MWLILILGVVVVMVLATLYGSFAWGLVFYKFWYWFVLPVFITLPAITLIQAIGLMLFMSLFKTIPSQIIKEDYINKEAGQIVSVVAPWVILLLGWIVKIFLFG